MTMLDQMRRHMGWLKWSLGLVVLAFIIFYRVDWQAVVPLSIGLLAGSMIGPRVARRIPARLLRWLAALLGMALAAW